MSTADEKGDALEHAVYQIEEVMHKVVPGLKGANATIERNKRIFRNGVRHENDIWVTVNPGTLYETFHTIECKNWNRPVGTDEVLKLGRKMQVLKLASATIIAREFTRDAVALAAETPHLALHHFADNFWSPLDYLECAATTSQAERGQVTLQFRDTEVPGGPVDYKTSTCHFRGRDVPFDHIISELIGRHLHGIVGRGNRFKMGGTHTGHTGCFCAFEELELFVNGHEVSWTSIEITYSVDVRPAKVVAKFDVEHRGGFIRMECPEGTFGHKDVALEIVTKASNTFRRGSD